MHVSQLSILILQKKKRKVEYLYSTFTAQVDPSKRSGMDHTAFNLPLHRKRSPDGASTKCGGEHLIAAHYSFIDHERMKG